MLAAVPAVPAVPAVAVARGVNFVLAREYVLHTHGQAMWERILAGLRAEDRRVWNSAVTVGTYDFAAFKAMIAVLADLSGVRDAGALAAMYAFIADKSLNTLYKVFFRLANPAFVIGNFPKLWSRFFTAGEVNVPEAQRERARLVFDVPEIFLDWLGPACLGYSTKAVELAGGRDVQVVEAGRQDLGGGSWRVTYAVTWREGA